MRTVTSQIPLLRDYTRGSMGSMAASLTSVLHWGDWVGSAVWAVHSAVCH
jgi:hypothetical protein